MTFLEPHAAYEQRNPDEREYAEQIERQRQAAWLQTHDTLDEYTPIRAFPCPGTLRVTDQNQNHRTIACDACTFVTTAKTSMKVGQEAW